MGALKRANRISRASAWNSTPDMERRFLNPNYLNEEEELYGTTVDEGGFAPRLWRR